MRQTHNDPATRAEEPSVPTTPPTKAGKEIFRQGVALLIGVGNCDHTPWSLPVTATDAKALGEVLLDPARCGYPADNVTIITDKSASRSGILSALEALNQQASGLQSSTAVIFYSGHGWQDENGQYYLVPSDAKNDDFTNTALRAEDFSQALRRIRPNRLLVILDTCHAAGMADAKSVLPPGFHLKALPEEIAPILAKGKDRVILCSCRDDEKSWILKDNSLSIFTHHLIEAFHGKGSSAKEKTVKVSKLMHHVSQEVPKSALAQGQTQTPFYKLESENFPVAAIQPTRKTDAGSEPERIPKTQGGGITYNETILRDSIAKNARIRGSVNVGSKINERPKRRK